MKYIKRIIASPFVLGIVLITHIFYAFRRTFDFIRYGGEFSNYGKDEKTTIQHIYGELKKSDISKRVLCPECDGKKEIIYSCCTGEVIDNDIELCPICKEHLGEEQCYNCDGIGTIIQND